MDGFNRPENVEYWPQQVSRRVSMLPLSLRQLCDPSLTAIGRLPARATLTPYLDEDACQAQYLPWRKPLNGTWRFQLVAAPESAPAGWTTDSIQSGAWRDIAVPGVWTRQQTGDLPHYANWRMPFDCQKPPAIPIENPTGLYRCTFQAPQDWMGRQTVLHLGGFESMVLVWCNGQFIGMGKDSRLPSEFDVSPALQAGANQLAVMVVRWSDATWIEDQDHWNHGGLHREVWLESRHTTHIRDLVIETDFDPDTGTGTARIRTEMEGPSAGCIVALRLEDEAGQTVAEPDPELVQQFDVAAPMAAQWKQSYTFDGYAARTEISLPKARPWSAETPTRYRLITQVLDPDGHCFEMHETWIGFTRIETSGRRLSVNGRPIVLIGVNRHDHHHENGKTCSRSDMRADLVTMKRHNINAIRTAHYPNDPALLDLADELGFYVIDEANVECHARWSEVANHPGYQAAIIDRTVRMIQRDRNHPCVIGWSLGNEAGHGPAFDAAAAAARHLDPSRFVHYEGAVARRFSFPFGKAPETTLKAPSASERATTDLVCPMYSPIDHIVEWARWAEETELDDRPLVLCEFSHAMGNSNGSISAYVDVFFAEPALAGGFVWDWRDQGLAETDANGRAYWAYGGHFGDEPNDANFNINGLVGPDGIPHPALREYMWSARPVVAKRLESGGLTLENRRAFADTSDLELEWRLQRDGETIESGTLDTVIEAGETIVLEPEFSTEMDNAAEWHLQMTWRLRENCAWAGRGHAVAWDQFALQPAQRSELVPIRRRPLLRPFNHEGFTLRFDQDGGISGVELATGAIISSPVTPCLWRAPTDNDGGKPGARPLFPNKTSEWVSYGLNALEPGPLQMRDLPRDYGLALGFERLWTGANNETLVHHSAWRFVEGKIVIDETFIIPEPWADLPRVGVRFEVPSSFRRLDWLGLGPDESYPDRHGAQTVGQWRSTVAEQYHPYVRPQEYGAREQCRWFRLTDETGAGAQISLPIPLSFTVRPYHDADLNAAETLAELTAPGTTEVHIDVGMRGLGTGACGPDALPQYRLGPGQYQMSWELKAIPASDD